MYVRRTVTRSLDTGEHYYTHRLVRSERVAGRVKQVTLLNLGRQFPLAPEQWPQLCTRIDELLRGQAAAIGGDWEPEVEREAQRLAALLLARAAEPRTAAHSAAPAPESVRIDSLDLARARSVGVEQVALWAIGELRLVETLQALGLAQRQILATVGMIVGRMALPGAEPAIRRWWAERSALGELLGVDLAAFGPLLLYRTGISLLKHRKDLETRLFERVRTLCELPQDEPIFDLTHNCCEGESGADARSLPGSAKRSPSGWPPVTLGLAIGESGFVLRSASFVGKGAEGATLQTMLAGLDAPPGALAVMDQRVATSANLAWLRAHGYRYLAVRREQARDYLPDPASGTLGAEDNLELRMAASADGRELALYCHSRELHAEAESRAARLEAGLQRIADAIAKPNGERQLDLLEERIARLKRRSGRVAQQYRIELVADSSGEQAESLAWERLAARGNPIVPPGVCCLRSSETDWDAGRLWRTYLALADLEGVFASLRPGPGLRPYQRPGEECAQAPLLISVLAYQCIQLVRRRLKSNGIVASWQTLRQILDGHCRVTASLRCDDGRTLHLRNATRPDPEQQAIYRSLGIDPAPGCAQRTIV